MILSFNYFEKIQRKFEMIAKIHFILFISRF